MAFTIKNPPEFTTEIPQWNRETPADGIEMAKVPEALLNNEVYLKKKIETHGHTRDQITDFPSALKNPSALTIKLNGASQGSYDGSAAKEINVTASGIGASPSSHSHEYTAITNRPKGLDSGYVRAGQKLNTTIGSYATAEGSSTVASSSSAHAEGSNTTASGSHAHAEGSNTTASGYDAHAEGASTTASNQRAHAEGSETTASGMNSHAEGNNTVAAGYDQHAQGHHNVGISGGNLYGTTGSAFIIGNGTSSEKSNAFRVDFNGKVYSKGAYATSGADYAEYFEWEDGNPSGEDRRGYFVTLEGDKIRKADSPDDYILGIISAKPVVIGNADPEWQGQFLKDEFGDYIIRHYKHEVMESVPEEVEETYTDAEGDEAYRAVIRITKKPVMREYDFYEVNPTFNPDIPYIPRSKRPEWAAVGMLGVLAVRDDGSCQVNGYCTAAPGGVATAAKHGYRVIARVTSHIVKIVYK